MTHTQKLHCLAWKSYAEAHALNPHTLTHTGATRISREWKPQRLKIRIFPLLLLLLLFLLLLLVCLFVSACGSWAYEIWHLRNLTSQNMFVTNWGTAGTYSCLSFYCCTWWIHSRVQQLIHTFLSGKCIFQVNKSSVIKNTLHSWSWFFRDWAQH